MGLIYFTIKRLFFSAQENLNTICKSKEKNSASEVLLEIYGWDNEIITCRIFIDYYIGVYIKKKIFIKILIKMQIFLFNCPIDKIFHKL